MLNTRVLAGAGETQDPSLPLQMNEEIDFERVLDCLSDNQQILEVSWENLVLLSIYLDQDPFAIRELLTFFPTYSVPENSPELILNWELVINESAERYLPHYSATVQRKDRPNPEILWVTPLRETPNRYMVELHCLRPLIEVETLPAGLCTEKGSLMSRTTADEFLGRLGIKGAHGANSAEPFYINMYEGDWNNHCAKVCQNSPSVLRAEHDCAHNPTMIYTIATTQGVKQLVHSMDRVVANNIMSRFQLRDVPHN